MLPLVGVPPTIAAGMKKYREVFCRDEGFDQRQPICEWSGVV